MGLGLTITDLWKSAGGGISGPKPRPDSALGSRARASNSATLRLRASTSAHPESSDAEMAGVVAGGNGPADPPEGGVGSATAGAGE